MKKAQKYSHLPDFPTFGSPLIHFPSTTHLPPSSNSTGTNPPQDLCTCCCLCLDLSSLRYLQGCPSTSFRTLFKCHPCSVTTFKIPSHPYPWDPSPFPAIFFFSRAVIITWLSESAWTSITLVHGEGPIPSEVLTWPFLGALYTERDISCLFPLVNPIRGAPPSYPHLNLITSQRPLLLMPSH